MAVSRQALIARRHGPDTDPTPGFSRIVAALGYDVTETIEQRRREHNEYGLGPGAVDRLRDRIRETDPSLVAVDNQLHEGQLVDLEAAISVAVKDRRDVVLAWLAAGGNRVADNRHTARQLRVRRRELRAGSSPADRSVADLERRLTECDDELDRLRTRARRRITEQQMAGKHHIVLAVTTGENQLWSELTGADGDDADDEGEPTAPLRPAQPRTDTATVDEHAVVVTDTPGTLGGLPAWYERVVPGTVAAIETADVVVTDDPELELEPTDARRVSLERGRGSESGAARLGPEGAGAVSALESQIGTALDDRSVAVEVQLPYTDDGRATSSWLHEVGSIEGRAYAEAIVLHVDLPRAALDELRTRIAGTAGTVQRRDG